MIDVRGNKRVGVSEARPHQLMWMWERAGGGTRLANLRQCSLSVPYACRSRYLTGALVCLTSLSPSLFFLSSILRSARFTYARALWLARPPPPHCRLSRLAWCPSPDMCALTTELDEGHRDNVACAQRTATPRSPCSLSLFCLLALVHSAVDFVFAACATRRAFLFHGTDMRVLMPACGCS